MMLTGALGSDRTMPIGIPNMYAANMEATENNLVLLSFHANDAFLDNVNESIKTKKGGIMSIMKARLSKKTLR